MTLPTLFISHGAPMLAIQPGDTGPALAALGNTLPRPKGIVMASAHWETPAPVASTARRPETIHDFGGFPDELYRIRYPAPGAPALARRVAQALNAAGLETSLDDARGLDHGAWVPLLYLYPDADVPVTQLSIQPHLSPIHHYRMGEALRPLLDEDVLVIGSGSLTHNLREFRARPGTVEPYVRAFQDWMQASLTLQDAAAVLDYRRLAPEAVRAHPTDEHLLPLFVAMGAAGACANARRVVEEVAYGVIAMDTYVFEPAGRPIRSAEPALSQ